MRILSKLVLLAALIAATPAAFAQSGGNAKIDVEKPYARATPAGAMFNMAVVVDAKARELILFMNGVEQGRSVLTEPLSAIEDVNNWLGRSQFAVDTRFGGSFHEFRIYDRALTQLQLIDSVAFGPSPAFLEPKSATQDGSGAP